MNTDGQGRQASAAKSARAPSRSRQPLLLALLAGIAFLGSYFAFSYAPGFGEKAALPKPPGPAPAGMVWIPGGEFTMGTDSDPGRADERPAHRVRVSGFWMDETDVTNAQFRAFVEATGYDRVGMKKEVVYG